MNRRQFVAASAALAAARPVFAQRGYYLCSRRELAFKFYPEPDASSGWVDMSHGLEAIWRRDGTYHMTFEQNYRAKNTVYHWHPPGIGP